VSDNPYRLPRTAVPRRYDVVLEPDLAAATFTGEVNIAIAVAEAVDELVLNANDLEIDSATVTGEESITAETRLDPETERLFLSLGRTIDPGEYTVRVAFRGVLNDKLVGFYRSTFTDESGATRVIATTQMESTDCRRAFPCWDEPDFKAVFGVTLVVPEDLFAVSNGPEIERTPADGGRVRIRYGDTMPMSTYLVAFVVGPLVATDPVDVNGTPVRLVHVPGKENLTAFGIDIGTFALRWFEDYYGIKYPGDKVDHVGLPDFAFGAMENLGCITYRESVLLVDPNSATQGEEETVADVVAHELAHMWFGDLVTMKWWNGIWLNEAFATYMGTSACDAFRPEWKRWVTFGLERSAALDTDALVTTRPIEYEVKSPADADGMFDVLTYEKGGSLLRMLDQYLGDYRFRDGVRHYLTKHSYGNTETSDLWDAIEESTGEPVRRIMDSWIWQGGYPLVSTRLTDDRASVVLSQRRFLLDPNAELSREDQLWAIPAHIRQTAGERSEETKVLLDGESITVPLLDRDALVLVNAGGNGFFRVSYEPALFDRFSGHALAGLSTIERYSLVDDTWAAVVSGAVPATAFLDLARRFADEPEVGVWRALLVGLRGISRVLEGEPLEQFRAYVRALVAPALTRLGWERRPDDDDLTNELRATLIGALGALGQDPDAQSKARQIHERALADPSSVDPSVLAAAIGVLAASGNKDDYEAFVERYQKAETPQEMLRYLYALSEFDSAELMKRTVELCFSDAVRTQNAPYVLGRALMNRNHGDVAWMAVRERWDEALAKFPSNSIVRMAAGVRELNRPEQAADVQAFFAEHPIEVGAKTLEQILERQRVNVALREREARALASAFDES